MNRMHLLLLFIGASFVCSCKKDQLQFQQVYQLNSNTTSALNNIRFLDDNICIIGGGQTFDQSTIVRSVDGGNTWSASTSADAPKEMYGMSVSADGTVYLSGIDGLVLHSKDKGATWQTGHIENWLVNRGGTFVTPDTGIFVSSVLQRQCTITRIDSSFKTIDEQTFLFGLNNIYMTDANTGYVIGYGVVMKTANRGNTWQYLDVDGDNFTATEIHGNEMWMCGSAGSIFHTIDAGAHWERFRNGNDITNVRYMLRCILFTDRLHGWAAGDDGKVIYTRDGGRNWMEYKNFTTKALRGIALCPNGNLLVAGDNGTLYRIVP